ncbi:MAG: metal-sensitive transcriptional regulator [Proteobacteria bacterium]|jgi:DNA-binding FrmR family transcriptional regulator|nr:metal-sensitive transcriptional regulator [Pseudomonadota bacterium]
MINEQVKKESLNRMKKIEGQIRGVSKMIEGEKYCVDILNQIAAVKSALDGVARKILKRHLESCVTEAILKRQAEEKIDELMNTIFKYGNNLR